MAEFTDTVHSVSEFGMLITGRSAPKTGYYYEQVYLGLDAATHVPELELSLQQQGPVPINDTVPTASLELIRAGDAAHAQIPEIAVARTSSGSSEFIETEPVTQTTPNGQWFTTGTFPLVGLVTLLMLGLLAWFLYFVVRMWQEHQSRLAIYRTVQYGPQEGETANTLLPQDTSIQEANAPILTRPPTGGDWRANLEQADATLRDLLEKHGIQGESMTDKLKNVSAGQFKSADIAWEAHQATRQLLSLPDAEVTDAAIARAKSLYKQVFADHGIVW